jgi:hypothetical protein
MGQGRGHGGARVGEAGEGRQQRGAGWWRRSDQPGSSHERKKKEREKRAHEFPATYNRESRELSAPWPSNTVPAQQHSFLLFCEFKYKRIITFYR